MDLICLDTNILIAHQRAKIADKIKVYQKLIPILFQRVTISKGKQ